MTFYVNGARADLLDQFIAPQVPGTDVQPDVTVQSRLHPDYAPLGYRNGPTMLRPELDETFALDSNATATPHARGSALFETSASLSADLDESSFKPNARLSVDDVRYIQQPGLSFTNWSASLGGGYQFQRDRLTVSFNHQNLNQTVEDLDVPALTRALPYRIDSLLMSYRADFDRLFVVPALTISNYSYDNGMAGGQLYLQSDRNHILYNPTLTVGYKFGRATIVGVLRDAVAQFTGPLDGLPLQNFNDVSVLGGIDYDAGSLLRYRLLAGYEVRTFASSAYKTIAAPIIEGTVIYSPTGLTTITAQAARRIQDAAAQLTVSLTESAVAIGVDHELYRNVLLHGGLSYTLDQFGAGQGQQSLTSANATLTWLLNRKLQLTAGYSFTSRRDIGTVRAQCEHADRGWAELQ